MKTKKTFSDKLWEKTGLSFWTDYPNLFKPNRYNWVNFVWVNLLMERDNMDNSFCIEAGILGLNIRWSLSLRGTTPQKEEILKRIKDMTNPPQEGKG